MPRSTRDSDEEVDLRIGRKTRALAGTTLTDSPLRRSTRISQAVKCYDSSPETPLSDSSNISNTQTRSTRRRTGTMDTFESQKSSRGRRISMSSDVTDNTDADYTPGTPVKTTRNSSRTGKQLTRASSEAKSPPTVTRTTRRTRACSMGPEGIAENKLSEKIQNEMTSLPIKTRRRMSALSFEGNIIEEKVEKEVLKIPVIALQRTLAHIKEDKETDLSTLSNKMQRRNSVTISKQETSVDASNTNQSMEKVVTNTIKEANDNIEKGQPSDNTESVQSNTSNVDEMVTVSNKEISENDGVIKDTVKETGVLSENVGHGITKELEIKIKDVFSMQQSNKILSNKENEIASENSSTNVQDTVSDTLLQTSKHIISTSVLNTSKFTEDKCKSPKVQVNLVTEHNISKELLKDSSNIVKECDNSDTVNNLVNSDVNMSASESQGNPGKSAELIVTSETESVNASVSINSSVLDDNVEIHKPSQKLIEADNEENMENLDTKTSDKDESMNMDVSVFIVEEVAANENDKTAENNESEVMEVDNKEKEEIDEKPKNDDGDVQSSTTAESETSTSKLSNAENASSVIHSSSNDTTSINKETTSDKCAEEIPDKDESAKETSVTNKSGANKKIPDKSQENMEVDDNESDTNVVGLFQDIPADEWKEKNNDTYENSVHSVSTERLENESEAECDLVLVDRDAWFRSKNMKTDEEKEASDYDSDDTVVIKAQKDLLNAKKNEKLINVTEEEDDLNASKNKIMNTNKERRNSMKQTQIEDKEESAENKDKNEDNANSSDAMQDTENVIQEDSETMEDGRRENTIKNESMLKSTKKQSIPKSNTSMRKSMGEDSLSAIHKADVSTNSPLNKSISSTKKEKLLNQSIQKVDGELKTSIETETGSEKKSLNKSKELEKIENQSGKKNTPAKKGGKNQSRNTSLKERINPEHLDENSLEESGNEVDNMKKHSCTTKKELTRNYSTVARSNSDISRNNSESDDSQNESTVLPKFIFEEASSNDSDTNNESNKSIDSDIQKEYNLHGDDISKFSDDDVPGDECRASETESSDPDDDGSDLAHFIVDDDEIEEEDDEEVDENKQNEEDEEAKVEEEDEEAVVEEEDEEAVVEEEDEEVEVEEEDEEVEVEEEDEEVEVEEEDENMEVDEKDAEMEVEKDVANKEESDDEDAEDQKVGELKKQNNSKQEKVETNTSLNISKKNKNQSRNSLNLTQSEKNKEKCNISSLSNSLKMKRTIQNQSSGDFIVEVLEQPLNDSSLIFSAKTQNTVACSTPKTNSSKFITSDKLLTETNYKKVKKMKSKENLMHKSLSPNSKLLVEKTDGLKTICSEELDLYKTLLATGNDTPTGKYLRKEKLNESVPVMKLGEFTELVNSSTHNEQIKTLKHMENLEQNTDDQKSIEEALQEADNPLKRKIFKLDIILKKQKQFKTGNTSSTLINESNFQETTEPQIIKSKQMDDSAAVTDMNGEQSVVPDKKRKRKKRVGKVKVEKSVEEIPEDFSETKSEKNNEITHNKKKKKKAQINEECADTNTENQISLKKKVKRKENVIPPEEEGLVEKLSKKKKKLSSNMVLDNEEILNKELPGKKKLKLSKNVASQSEDEISTEKLPKKKQELQSNNVLAQSAEILDEKVPKKKKKLLLTNTGSQDKEISTEIVFKKKQKLSSNVPADDEEISNTKLPKKKKKTDDLQDQQVSLKKLPKKKQKLLSSSSSQNEEIPYDKKLNKKESLSKNNASQNEEVSIKELPKKIQKLLRSGPNNSDNVNVVILKKQQSNNADANSDERLEVVAFSSARDEALEVAKHTADNIKTNKETKKKKQEDRQIKNQKLESKHRIRTNKTQETRINRLSDETIENLSDIPLKLLKKRKLLQTDEQMPLLVLNSKVKRKKLNEGEFTVASISGSTTKFVVEDLQKIKKNKIPKAVQFKRKMLSRNARQPVSAYLMYLEKQKASAKNKFCN